MTADNRSSEQGLFSNADEPVQAEFDWGNISPSTAVVETVARASNRDPTATNPLYNAIDPDALDSLCGSTDTSTPDEHVSVEFAFEGYEVRVDSVGTIELMSLDPNT